MCSRTVPRRCSVVRLGSLLPLGKPESRSIRVLPLDASTLRPAGSSAARSVQECTLGPEGSVEVAGAVVLMRRRMDSAPSFVTAVANLALAGAGSTLSVVGGGVITLAPVSLAISTAKLARNRRLSALALCA